MSRRAQARVAAALLAMDRRRRGGGARAGAFRSHLWVRLVGRAASHAGRAQLARRRHRQLTFGDGDRWQGAALGEAQLLADWEPNERFATHLHARARAQNDGGGDAAGVVEAWAQLTAKPRGGADVFRLRAGQLFLPTSRENLEPLWSSPFTYTLSAVNSWIGEEVRPIGVLADYELVGAAHGARAGLCAFGGNDASGALLAWRGWAMGDRLSTLGETLPLPALPSLDPGGPFAGQDRDGTTPIGSDPRRAAGLGRLPARAVRRPRSRAGHALRQPRRPRAPSRRVRLGHAVRPARLPAAPARLRDAARLDDFRRAPAWQDDDGVADAGRGRQLPRRLPAGLLGAPSRQVSRLGALGRLRHPRPRPAARRRAQRRGRPRLGPRRCCGR
jgi:hypothetical protein